MAIKCKINAYAKRRPGPKGECPECLTPDAPTSKKGYVAAHNIKINLGDGPTIPLTDHGNYIGDPRDAATRREIDAIRTKTGARPTDKNAQPDPVMVTGHGRAPALVRGPAMPPTQPTSGYQAAAGTMAGPLGRERTEPEPMHGGRLGHLTTPQYMALSRTQRRKYWAKIKNRRDHKNTPTRLASPRLGTGGLGSRGFTDGPHRDTETLMQQPRS